MLMSSVVSNGSKSKGAREARSQQAAWRDATLKRNKDAAKWLAGGWRAGKRRENVLLCWQMTPQRGKRTVGRYRSADPMDHFFWRESQGRVLGNSGPMIGLSCRGDRPCTGHPNSGIIRGHHAVRHSFKQVLIYWVPSPSPLQRVGASENVAMPSVVR
jgi:hypothetical protein